METLIYEKLKNDRVKCGICNHFCIIESGKRGLCHVRENRDGVLTSLVYPRLIASSVDPIEKKPLYHLKPGSTSYSVATVGCNLKCEFCQNAGIAQMPADRNGMIQGDTVYPGDIVEDAVRTGCDSISYTYTEPTVYLELALETARLAKKKGLYNIFVTNGFMSPDVVQLLEPVLDAANVDLKAFNDRFYKKYCKASLEPVKENLKAMKAAGIMVEVTTLLIPGLNDDDTEIRDMTRFIARDLGPETPWHVSRFHPSYRLTDVGPTRIQALEQAARIGKAEGLYHVYTGNAPGLDTENTFCHACNKLLVDRYGYRIKNHMTTPGQCPACNTPLHGIY